MFKIFKGVYTNYCLVFVVMSILMKLYKPRVQVFKENKT